MVTWAIMLFFLALAMLVLELFLPSGGLLSLLSAAMLITSIVLVVYDKGFGAGTLYLGFLAILIPLLAMTGLKYWPHTPIGRMMLNVDPDHAGEPSAAPKNAELLGQQGVTLTKMLPSGAVRIDGKTYDAVAEGAGFEKGQTVEVVSVDGMRIVVGRVSGNRRDQSAATGDESPAVTKVADPFEDPLI